MRRQVMLLGKNPLRLHYIILYMRRFRETFLTSMKGGTHAHNPVIRLCDNGKKKLAGATSLFIICGAVELIRKLETLYQAAIRDHLDL